MKSISYLQIATAVILIMAILLQSRSKGLSGVFGGDSTVYRSRRGLEKGLFYLTIILSIALLSLSIINIVMR